MNQETERTASGAVSLKKRVLLVACIISATGALLVNIMPLFLGSAADYIALNDQQIGWLGSSFLAGFGLVSISSPFWIQRFDWKWLCYGSFIAITALMALCALVERFLPLVVVLAAIGVGCGFLYTLGVAIIAESDDPDRFFGWKLMCEIGAGIGLMLLLPNLAMGRWGFPGVVVTIALVFMAFALLILWLRESVCAHEPPTPDAASCSTDQFAQLNTPVWIGLLFLLVHFSGVNGVWAFVERIGDDMGIDAEQIGAILSTSLFLGGAGAFAAGMIGDRFGRSLPLIVGMGGMLLAVFLLATGSDPFSYTVAVCLIMGFWPFILSYQMGLVVSADHTGRLAVLIAAAMALGGAIGPAVAGMLKTGDSYLPIYLMMGGLTLISLLAFLGLAAYLKRSSALSALRAAPQTG